LNAGSSDDRRVTLRDQRRNPKSKRGAQTTHELDRILNYRQIPRIMVLGGGVKSLRLIRLGF
jgi:hypothetical protein